MFWGHYKLYYLYFAATILILMYLFLDGLQPRTQQVRDGKSALLKEPIGKAAQNCSDHFAAGNSWDFENLMGCSCFLSINVHAFFSKKKLPAQQSVMPAPCDDEHLAPDKIQVVEQKRSTLGHTLASYVDPVLTLLKTNVFDY